MTTLLSSIVTAAGDRPAGVTLRYLNGRTEPVGVIYTLPNGHELSVLYVDHVWESVTFGHYDAEDELIGDEVTRTVGELTRDGMTTRQDVVRLIAAEVASVFRTIHA